ncbi:hypothetical protein ACVIJ6_007297 [Bradyrhizobium sp. USDA 4369]
MTASVVTHRRRDQGAHASDLILTSPPQAGVSKDGCECKGGSLAGRATARRANQVPRSKCCPVPAAKNKALVDFVKSALQSARSVASEGTYRGRHGRRQRNAMGVSRCSVISRADERRCTHGQVARSWHPDAGVPRNARQARCAHGGQKPAHRGEREAAVKTVAQGGPDVFGQTCGTCRLHSFPQAGHGRGQRPAFPAPSVWRRAMLEIKARTQNAPRDRGGAFAWFSTCCLTM